MEKSDAPGTFIVFSVIARALNVTHAELFAPVLRSKEMFLEATTLADPVTLMAGGVAGLVSTTINGNGICL
jgi:hypothetical protein